MLDKNPANGSPTRFEPVPPEDFRTYAFAELAAAPPWASGVCFRPECGRRFSKCRDWQIYCSPKCSRDSAAEFRVWGNRLALSALIWRMGKYEQHDAGIRDLSRAARRHLGHVQSAWLEDRHARASNGKAGK